MIKHVRIGILLDIYGSLLTNRQLQILNTYYNEDMSLSEIAYQRLLKNLTFQDKEYLIMLKKVRKNY